MKRAFGIIMGVILIAAGIIFALDTLGITQFKLSLDGWWTLFIIVPSFCGLVESRDKSGSLIGLLVGVYLLLASRDIIDFGSIWKMIVPLIIVIIGIKLIVKNIGGEKIETMQPENGKAESVAAFNSVETDYSGQEVNLAKVGAVFGGAKCNLSDACLDENSRVDVFCMFGGADIIVPENVKVKINAFCLFGGISDKRAVKDTSAAGPVICINGFCMFGGADIK